MDSQGAVWQPAPAGAISGGSTSTAQGGIGSTGSPQLYLPRRIGVRSWAIDVPGSGRYAVDILVCDTTADGPGDRVFAVTANGGSGTLTLDSHVDADALVNGWHPFHVTGVVDVSGTRLMLNFAPTRGETLINGVAVSYQRAAGPVQTDLDQNFGGPAGAAPESTLWQYTTGTGWEGSSGLENYTNSRSNSQLDGAGDLVITARHGQATAASPSGWTSAELTTKGTFDFGYGSVEARIQVPAGNGMWPAFWAVGADQDTVDWPACGEIDVLESRGSYPGVVSGHAIYLGNAADPTTGYKNYRMGQQGADWNSGTDIVGGFHTYAVRYMPGAITYLFDGREYFTAAVEDLNSGESWPFDGKPFHILLDLAVGNSAWAGYADEPAGFSADMRIDYVRVTS